MIAVLLDRPLKQAAAGRESAARFALREVERLPIRYRFSRILPQGRLEHA